MFPCEGAERSGAADLGAGAERAGADFTGAWRLVCPRVLKSRACVPLL